MHTFKLSTCRSTQPSTTKTQQQTLPSAAPRAVRATTHRLGGHCVAGGAGGATLAAAVTAAVAEAPPAPAGRDTKASAAACTSPTRADPTAWPWAEPSLPPPRPPTTACTHASKHTAHSAANCSLQANTQLTQPPTTAGASTPANTHSSHSRQQQPSAPQGQRPKHKNSFLVTRVLRSTDHGGGHPVTGLNASGFTHALRHGAQRDDLVLVRGQQQQRHIWTDLLHAGRRERVNMAQLQPSTAL